MRLISAKMKLIIIEGSDSLNLVELLLDKEAQHGIPVMCASPLDFFKDSSIIPEKLPEAFTQCKIRVKGAMKKGVKSIVIPYTWGNHGGGTWAKQYYLNLAKEFGYEVQEIFTRQRNVKQEEHHSGV